MILIDVDKLVNDIAEHITVKAVSRVLAIIQGQPTVKAISIEWLKRYELAKGQEVRLQEAINEWEKENERP